MKREGPKLKPSWAPVRRGAVFCSSACGRGCTYAEYRRAKTRAEAAARALRKAFGPGWTPETHENLGWFPSVMSPCRRIYVSVSVGWITEFVTYTAFLGEPDSRSGQWTGHGQTVYTAVRKACQAARADLKRLGAVIKNLPA